MYTQDFIPDRHARNESAARLRVKMAADLAGGWMGGEHTSIAKIINGAGDAFMRQQWLSDTADALPSDEREKFLAYMKV